MIIYPAIDLRGGKVVRLREGDPEQQTVFSDDPVTTAKNWEKQGAVWLHMVNLDGAFSEANANRSILAQAAEQTDLSIQFGGGLRSLADIESVLKQGARRVVLGTLALKNPDVVDAAIKQFGAEAICVALDARDGKVTTHGWTEVSELTPVDVGKAMADRGVRHALFTDVSRDGMLSGANTQATIELAEKTGLEVIASGGIRSIDELAQLAQSGSVAGAIVGMALYQGVFSLEAALSAINEENL
ncbi:MAG: 1-(5-phosphoribosyl)-5-[(5-phosphoribosylamino)methylideneamino]imidazole-4-carboxamide isomerase [Anaerolineaceae bacterium]|nr:1-(5-phosphoribosyl)-5-[(5-phosphoribosylamino)methylideneamino]imidazole-4-carboxamide isomerase [Anaerolineaceae bacterium]